MGFTCSIALYKLKNINNNTFVFVIKMYGISIFLTIFTKTFMSHFLDTNIIVLDFHLKPFILCFYLKEGIVTSFENKIIHELRIRRNCFLKLCQIKGDKHILEQCHYTVGVGNFKMMFQIFRASIPLKEWRVPFWRQWYLNIYHSILIELNFKALRRAFYLNI